VDRSNAGLQPGAYLWLTASARKSYPNVANFLAAGTASVQDFHMPHEFTTSYIQESLTVFRQYKRLAERAMEQCPDHALFAQLDPESNSIAIIVKHMVGNMRSRWRSFLTTDGEKPDRNRDTEFQDAPKTREELMAVWGAGWKYVFDALEPLGEADLGKTVTIRTEPHSVMQAINRQVAHYSHHIGQIVYAAKHLTATSSGRWASLSVPRGQSAQSLADVATEKKSQR
jgi:hypothetical protein